MSCVPAPARELKSRQASSHLRGRSSPRRLLRGRLASALQIAVVLAVALLVLPGEASAELQAHGSFLLDTSQCAMCHSTHNASAMTTHLLGPSTLQSESELCYVCHGSGSPGANADMQAGPDSFGQPSGHKLEGVLGEGDLTNECSSCHSPHESAMTDPNLPQPSINGTEVGGDAMSWCLACHDDKRSWEPTGYPDVAHPVRDAAGYPVQGTFPGSPTYLDSARNAHALIPTTSPDQVVGDCRNCHNTHGGPNAYDALTYTYRPSSTSTVVEDRISGTYAQSCLECHGGQPDWIERGASDIKSFVTSNGANPDSNGGHRIKTIGATQPLDSPLLCYECHGAHGSSRGNSSLISDERGTQLRTDTPEHVRQFCFTCHTSDDQKVWNSVAATFTAVSDTETVSGLRRDGTLLPGQSSSDASSTTNWLLLNPESQAHSSTDLESCYVCHGFGDYPTATGNNVHNPGSGTTSSLGTEARQLPCYDCHAAFQASMEDGEGSKTGSRRTDAYHHVMGGPTADGDAPFASGLADSTTEMRCTSCHGGHSAESTQSAMLRAGVGLPASETANSDYLVSGSNGICVSCHGEGLPKDTTDQKSDGSTSTPVVPGGSDAGEFGASAHNFEVAIQFGDGSALGMNCQKCHSDALSAYDPAAVSGESNHFFANSRLLGALGDTAIPDPAQETVCFRCHSMSTDAVGGTPKVTSNKDWYGVTTMTAASESTFREFSLASRHPIAGTVSGNVECANCHNVHSVGASNALSDPFNTYNTYDYSTPFSRSQFCLKCHSGSALPTSQVSPTQFVPWSVTISAGDSAIMDKSGNSMRSHWTANGSIADTETVECGACHDEHGSNAPKLLGQFDPLTGTSRIGTTTIAANDNSVCFSCHAGGTAGTQSLDASGYPTDGRWPGEAVFTGSDGIHGRVTVQRPGTTYGGGDCKNCHDVHGTASSYDELTGSPYTSSFFGFCFDCHNETHEAGLNMWEYYPIEVGGTSYDPLSGHATVSDGVRPAGSAMPCYDCHNSHGSANAEALEVHAWTGPTTMEIVGDEASEIDILTNVGMRNFCFTCHTTSDTAKGWNGSSLATVTSGTLVEGIDRTSASSLLRLPDTLTEHTEAATQNCEGALCHGHTSATGPADIHDPRVN